MKWQIKNRLAEHVKVKERKENRKITQRDIEAETGVSTPTVGSYLRNEVRRTDLEVMSKFCRWLPIRPEEFLTWDDEVDPGEESEENSALLAIPA